LAKIILLTFGFLSVIHILAEPFLVNGFFATAWLKAAETRYFFHNPASLAVKSLPILYYAKAFFIECRVYYSGSGEVGVSPVTWPRFIRWEIKPW